MPDSPGKAENPAKHMDVRSANAVRRTTGVGQGQEVRRAGVINNEDNNHGSGSAGTDSRGRGQLTSSRGAAYHQTVMETVHLSLVVPCFNEAARLPRALPVMLDYLRRQDYAWELLLVDDGSSDGTAALIAAAAREEPRVRAIHLPRNIGKGGTVKHGLLAATGAHVFFSDTDLSTPLAYLADGLQLLGQGADFVYANRHMPGAQLRGYSPLRRLMSHVFNCCARALLLPGITDTQCGFKGFRRTILEPLLQRSSETHFAFDVELLVIAREQGWRTQGFPVVWDNVAASTIKPFSDVPAMFIALLAIRQRRRAGLYR